MYDFRIVRQEDLAGAYAQRFTDELDRLSGEGWEVVSINTTAGPTHIAYLQRIKDYERVMKMRNDWFETKLRLAGLR